VVRGRRGSAALVATGFALLAAACSDDGEGGATATSEPATTTTTAPAYPLDDTLRLNEIQALGSHNSYHVQAEPALLAALQAFDAALAATLEYTHAPLEEQFDAQGVRQIELDVFADPSGGLYASRAGNAVIGLPRESGEPALDEPGFKVLHVQDIDFATTCLTFVACLTSVRDWSQANPGHVPILVLVEVKDDPIPDPGLGFVVPLPVGPADLDALDAEIRSVFESEELLTPDDVRGDHASLEEAVLTDGWPTLGATRGRVLFALDNEDEIRDAYVAGHPSLEGRVLFTSSPPGTPEAAFLKLNDPVAGEATIRQAVLDGYVVRTRADADTQQARTGDTTVRDAALRSGAQWVSTDYPVPENRFGTGYVASIPGGTPARCNPVIQPPTCTPADIEDPAVLATD
jgi:Phosphoinositide phospholipase C, Ca2+-dependent